MRTPQSENGNYMTIVQGKFRETVDEKTEGAVKRDWENKKTGEKGTKWELVFKDVRGIIENVEFRDSDFGEQLKIKLRDIADVYTISMPSDSRYASDFLKRLPNVDFTKEVTLVPYDIEDEKGRNTGVKIAQENVTIKGAFYDAENKVNINGFPNVPKPNAKMTKDDWKIYFIQVKQFLKQYTEEVVVPRIKDSKVAERPAPQAKDESGDLPF